MSDQNTADNWRLEDTGKTGKQWKLQETEQNRISQWQLQDDGYDEAGWQPVAYERESRQQGGGWVLPSLVGLALVAVVAYGAWIGLTQINPISGFNFGSILSVATATPLPTTAPVVSEPLPTETLAVVVNPTATVAPTPLPTATLPAGPAPTAAPALVDLKYVRITNQYGVNARSEPSTQAEIVDLLEVDEIYLLQQTQDEWLQVAISDGVLAWISAEFAQQFTQQKPLAEANNELAALGLPTLAAPAAAPANEPPVIPTLASTGTVTSTAAPVASTDLTTTVGTTTTVLATGTAPTTAGATLTGTVTITAGLNARSAPDANAAVVTLLAGNLELTITGRISDNTWLRTTVSDSIPAWVFAEFVALGGDINSLPVVGADGQVAPTPITGTLITTTSTITTTPTPAIAPPTGATATVNTILGAGVRQAPSRDAEAITTVPFDRVYAVLARSADNEWVEITLEADKQGWVLVSTVELSVDLAALPVVVP